MKQLLTITAAVSLISGICIAKDQMPIIQTKYTADPAPLVHNDTIFLYTSHDEDDADGFKMLDWLLFTSTDMVNWTEHGAVASLKDFKWHGRDNGAWAIQVVERNGKYYMYCPIHGNGIGVLVADSPYGPFKDPIGKPLVWQKEHWDDIDPTVLIDDDGQAYMYWGNPNLYSVKLNEDMISYSGDIVVHPHIEDYQEGPWLYKHNGKYYLAFASTCCPEGIGYAMSDSPTGPWEYKGHIMDHTPRTRGNHPGLMDYKGKSYVFGHSYDILRLETPDHHERRSVNAAEMTFNTDGTIKEVPYWKDIELKQIAPFDPYRKVEAETMSWGYGLKCKPIGFRNMTVTNIDNGEYIKVSGVDFGEKGPVKFRATVATDKGNKTDKNSLGYIILRAGSSEAKPFAIMPVKPTGSFDTYTTYTVNTQNKPTGIQDLYITFKGQGDNLFNFDNWELIK